MGREGEQVPEMTDEYVNSVSERCFAIHSLNTYHPYSIPDILRMNNFDVTVTIKKVVAM